MVTISTVALEAADPAAASAFYDAAFGLGERVTTRAVSGPRSGFRGFTLSLVVRQPGDVDALFGAAVVGGASVLKPAAKSLWGYGGFLQAPDGAIWTIATSAKKDTAPVTRRIDDVVLLLACADVAASKRFYVERGMTVARSFGRYVSSPLPTAGSSWRCTGGRPSPRTPASPLPAPARPASSSVRTWARSPTSTDSAGSPWTRSRRAPPAPEAGRPGR